MLPEELQEVKQKKQLREKRGRCGGRTGENFP